MGFPRRSGCDGSSVTIAAAARAGGEEVLVTGPLNGTSYTKDGVEIRDVEIRRAHDVEFLRRA
jgi:hypothetical protein